MSTLPYIRLYVADYLKDTPHLDTETHGAYLLLIFSYWQTGKPIPANRVQAISKVSNERWTDVEQTLNEFFTIDEQGNWIHDRVEEELGEVREKSERASAAGKASAVSRRKNKGKKRVKPCLLYTSPSPRDGLLSRMPSSA